MKKLCLLIICVSILMTGCNQQKAAPNVLNINVEGTTAKAGKIAEVKINLKNVPAKGILTMLLDLSYDKSKFSFIKFNAGPIVSDPEKNTECNADNKVATGLKILYGFSITESYIKEDGLFCTLQFKVSPNCKPGTYNIKLLQGRDGKTQACTMPESDGKDAGVLEQVLNAGEINVTN